MVENHSVNAIFQYVTINHNHFYCVSHGPSQQVYLLPPFPAFFSSHLFNKF